jgi:hypothetical protein
MKKCAFLSKTKTFLSDPKLLKSSASVFVFVCVHVHVFEFVWLFVFLCKQEVTQKAILQFCVHMCV